MDWYVDATDGNAVRELRREFGDYLRRHGNGHSDVDAAELAPDRRAAGREQARRRQPRLGDAAGAARGRRPRRQRRTAPSTRARSCGRSSSSSPSTSSATTGRTPTAAAGAQVGADVGGRMEDEFRRARGIVDKLSPEQMGELYVRLKHAIDGDFYVIEVTPEKIVLGNRRCPFGDAVRRAPTLCRMTSSVFGGIAARNAGGASVQLEERIAVGDPECRVTVGLGPQNGRAGFAHAYG